MEKLTTITFVFDREKKHYAWRADFCKSKEEAVEHFAKLIDDHGYSEQNDTIGTEWADVAHVQDLLNCLYNECFEACASLIKASEKQ